MQCIAFLCSTEDSTTTNSTWSLLKLGLEDVVNLLLVVSLLLLASWFSNCIWWSLVWYCLYPVFLGGGWQLCCSLYSPACPLRWLPCKWVTHLPPVWVWCVLGSSWWCGCCGGDSSCLYCQLSLVLIHLSWWVAKCLGTCTLAGWVWYLSLVGFILDAIQLLFLLSFGQ